MPGTHASESDKRNDDRDYDVVVNGELFTVEEETISYAQVIQLAYSTPPFAEPLYTVTFRKAHKPHEGTLVEGQTVEVKKKGTTFTVIVTDRS